MSDDEPIIGIDLGTTYSVVSIFQNNQVKVFQDELGNKIIPSYVAFENEDKMLVGDMAKIKLEESGTVIIYDVKRLIGRTYDDPNVKKDKKNWPFKIREDSKTKKLKIVVDVKISRKENLKELNEKKNFPRAENLVSFKVKKKDVLNGEKEYKTDYIKYRNPTIEKEFTPEEISSYILKNLKKMAENDLIFFFLIKYKIYKYQKKIFFFYHI